MAITAGSALAQPAAVPTFDIWRVQLGEPITQIPFREIAFAACGTNGGPPSIMLNELEHYATCRPEESGLYELYFEYDDEQAYIARALRVEFEAMSAATSMYGHPIIPSVLVDRDGIVRGIRVVTDDRTTDDTRAMAVRLAVNLQNRFSSWNLQCQHIPPSEGQTPVGNRFVYDLCTGVNESLGQRLAIEAHFFRRPGQAGIDIHSQRFVEGAFESTTRLELVQAPYEPTTAEAE